DNYVRMFGDAQVWHAVANTLLYTVFVVPPSIIFAIVIAVLLNGKIRGKSFFRTIYFIPMIAAPAAITMVWRWLYNPQFGLINYVLTQLGLDPVKWTTDPRVA